MKIAPFGVEQWMNEWETGAVTNLAETCVDSMTVGELLDLTGKKGEILSEIERLRLSYGDIKGSEDLLAGLASLYEKQDSSNIMVMNGGSAANFISLYTLVEPGDEVICAYPTYQQLYSIPESFGANVRLLRLKEENGFLPDLGELAGMVSGKTKLICLNNSNNPTGSLMGAEMLGSIAEIARRAGAWIHCDEVYRFMVHDETESKSIPSIADIYERGVASCSLSKCFSLAGLRVGWLAGPSGFIDEVFARRDYTTISCGRIDDMLGRIAIKHREPILRRNRGIVLKCAKILDDWVSGEPRVGYVKPKAGTTAFLKYDCDMGSGAFCKALFERDGTFLLPGACFGEEFDRYLRIGYAYSPDVLERGLERVSAFLGTLE